MDLLPDETIEEPRADPEAALGHAELARALERALAWLSGDRERAARAHLTGFSVEEIERLYGWSYQKARNLIARGMADLRARLRDEGIDEG